ncbi:MAG: FAD-binding oxidoreductase [Pseudomonadales bacterium]|nr:FAD-binding oxidoreductase [Pseudomonadales bacterium]
MNRRQALRGLLATATTMGWLGGCAAGRVQSPLPVWGDTFGRRLVYRDDPDYEAWRTGAAWQNYKHARYPDVIARPQSVDEVVTCVQLAIRDNLRVAVRSGGHNVSGAFLRDGGMLLDLGALRDVHIDAAARTAWVGPAIWSRNLAQRLGAAGFAFPYAHCATVPMGGYLLGGGVGVNGDSWGGIACANILAADVVLASGERVTVSADDHPDLYWAVRGGGTGFPGVVTAYRLRLHDAPTHVVASAYVFPVTAAGDAAGWLERVRASAPAKTELMMLMARGPAGPMAVVRFAAFAQSADEAKRLLTPYARAPEAAQALARMEFVPGSMERSFIESMDATRGLGFGSYAVETVWTDDLPASAAATVDLFGQAPSPGTHLLISPRINNRVPGDAAFSRIGRSFLGAYTVWKDPADDADNHAWLADMTQVMGRGAAGRYVNETDGFAARERVLTCYSDTAWERLGAVREKYDPWQRFHGFPGWDAA